MDPTTTAPTRGATFTAWKWLQMPLVAGSLLLVAYLGLSFVNDSAGTLSTDVGGKVATLRVMDAWDTAAPEVGYWASDWDPEAELHGLYYTSVVDGKYVNVTSVPVMELARPLFAVGGYRAALLWSMLGGVACAFAARALAGRAGGDDRRAWLAFWLAGMASPVLLYSLDLWEHTPGLALMAWGVVAMVDHVSGRPRWTALASGLAFGAAFSMRTEAAAYGFVVVAVGCVILWRRRGLVAGILGGALAAAGFVVLAVANTLLEVAVLGGPLRASRSSGAAASGGGELTLRLKEAVTTTVGLFPDTSTGPLVLGLAVAGLLGLMVWRTSRPGDRGVARLAFAGVVALFLVRAADGVGFVPGLVATAPFAVAGFVLAFDRRVARPGRDAVLMTTVALPIVWYFQYSGGAAPQWGGRYVLTTMLVLGAVGIGASGLLDRWVQVALAALSVAIAVFGLASMSYRTHEIGRAAHEVAGISGPVVSIQGFWLRELGAVYDSDTKWLSLKGTADLGAATAVMNAAGERSFTLLWTPGGADAEAPQLPGWTAGDGRTETWLGIDFRLTPYERQ